MKKRVFGIMICLLVLAAGAALAQAEEPAGEAPAPTAPAPVQPAPEYQNFTGGQRGGTWALNAFTIPGLGSFVIMKDVLGGSIQAAVGGTGLILAIVGGVRIGLAAKKIIDDVNSDVNKVQGAVKDPTNAGNVEPKTDVEAFLEALKENAGLAAIGGVLIVGNQIFNIVRSVTYDKPKPKVGSLADPNAWSLAIVPGTNGEVEQVSLAYTLRY